MGIPNFRPPPEPDIPHIVEFAPEWIESDKPKFFIEKCECIICGATEETEICSRTVQG